MTRPVVETVWMGIGFLGQGIFTARLLVQWIASERESDAVVPVAFWWISLFGGLTLLAYTVHKRDAPLVVGQALGVCVYARNLVLVAKAQRRAEVRAEAETTVAGSPVAEG